jgi:GNAT superfamily N-acetyltransferase
MEWRRGEHVVSDEPGRIDRARVWRFLAEESYWAQGIPPQTVERAIEHSLCFGLYRDGAQVGFARVVTDRATFGYLCDVFVEPAERGAGLGEWMVSCVLEHPELQGLRRLCLVTRDAHGLYERFGFRPMPDPSRYLEIHQPDVYGGRR